MESSSKSKMKTLIVTESKSEKPTLGEELSDIESDLIVFARFSGPSKSEVRVLSGKSLTHDYTRMDWAWSDNG